MRAIVSVVAGGDGVYELRFVVFESTSHEEVLIFPRKLGRGDWSGGVRLHYLPGVIEHCRGSFRTSFEAFSCWCLLCSSVP